ncbi:MAG: tRNA uridine-5-carboxymethylaminomethyl(34) synthesis GTPase MnmE [Betaproteobacteria bacterium]|nr:MAG: tRNA uridine-5-carboxymethylaminomethyl(34) synthesis GTPase MnmE [Betaproteobacteria bacterium]
MDAVDTIAAIATPPGAGGIGIVRVSGPLVPALMSAIVGRRLEPRWASFTRFRDETGAPIDEGIAVYFPAPHSYTAEDVLELHGHGGPVVLGSLLKRCLAAGARIAQPGEFTKRAFLNGKMDLAQAEAVADLIAAGSDQAARSAAQSLTGEFSRRVARFQAELTELRVLLEGSLDFPDEGIDFLVEEKVAERLARLLDSVQLALRAGSAGRLLQDGITVALVGLPNSGKSSIINELCGDDVAIVTPIPGTTRDLIRETVSFEGIPIHVVDTAGIRPARDVVEEIGIARTWDVVHKAEALLLVQDASDPHARGADLMASLPRGVPTVHVHNKIDLLGVDPRVEYIDGDPHVWISAKLGLGMDRLHEALVSLFMDRTAIEGAFSARARHLDALRRTLDHVHEARGKLEQAEIAAEALRCAQRTLSEITGEFLADDLLGEIFSRFCIGK